MPTWVIAVTSVLFIIVIMWGIATFAFVPMFFGVYSEARQTLRGKLIIALLWLFPPACAVSLYIAWSSDGYFALVPYAYLIALWLIRANKDAGQAPTRLYHARQDNLRDITATIDNCWQAWSELDPARHYLLFTFFAPGEDEAHALHAKLKTLDHRHGEIETMPMPKHTVRLYAGVAIDRIERPAVERIAGKMVNLAWEDNCELTIFDIVEILD